MANSVLIKLLMALAVYSGLAKCTYVNVTLSKTAVEVGGSFGFTVDFDFKNSNFVSLKCGYGTSPSFVAFAEFNRFTQTLELVTSGFPVAYNGRITISSGKTMTISNVGFSDEGTKYECEFKYYNSTAKATQTLYSNNPNLATVYALPVFGTNSLTSNSDIIEGKNTTLKCNVTSRPASSITWSYDKSKINAGASMSSATNGYYTTVIGLLTIMNVDMMMNGEQVNCTATPMYGGAISAVTTLNVLYLPKNVSMTISPQNPKQNEIITINCNAVGKPAVTNYLFYLNDTYLGNSVNGTLVINATDCKDFTGIYKCSAVNTVGAAANATEGVLVTAPVKITTKISSKTVNETANVTMQCYATGCPAPSVHWTKMGNNSVIAYGNRLELTSVTKDTAGTYQCFADNGATNDTLQAMLSVNYKPISTALITATLKPVQNSHVMINCSADAVPNAMYKFYQVINGNETEISSATSQESGALTISNINVIPGSYDVTYKCVPYNMLGQGPPKDVTLNIQVPPKVTASMIPDTVNASGDATLHCVVTAANPAANVTGHDPSNNMISLVNGTAQITNVTRATSGRFSCRADNGVGSPVVEYAYLFVNHKPEMTVLKSSTVKPLNGGSVTLNCSSTARPEASYRFYRVDKSNETEIPNSGSGILTINPINYLDFGGYQVTYKCMPYNMLGNGPAESIQLDIQVPPKLYVSQNLTVNKNQTAAFTCETTAANPPATITWYDASNKQLSHSNGTLRLYSVSRHQAGQYYCKADNNVTGSPVTKAVTLTVNFSPENVNITVDTSLTIRNGSSVTIQCTSLAVPAAEYVFYEMIGGITKMVSSSNSISSGVLHITNIETDLATYKTIYKCMPKNSLGNGTMKMLEFNVLVPPSEVMITPNTATHTVNETQRVELNCSAKYGNPKPAIAWTSSVNSDSFTGSLISLNNVSRNDAKTYTCSAVNSIATRTKSIALTVQYAPEVKDRNVTFTRCETQSVNLTCIATGIPLPDVRILSPQATVVESGKGAIYHEISSLTANQFGLYICATSNVVGRLHIARYVMKPDTPGAVQAVSIKSDKGEFEVSWSTPVCKSHAGIKEYIVSYKKTGATSWEKSSTTQTPPFKITNLENAKEYIISVAVVANNGKIGPEATKTATATEKKGPDPGESKGNKAAMIGGIAGGCFVFLILVIILVLYCSKKRNHTQVLPRDMLDFSLKSIGCDKVLVKWDSSANLNALGVNHYDIFWKMPGRTEAVKSVRNHGKSYAELIDGLESGARYEFRIVAVSRNGHSGRCSITKMLRIDPIETGNGAVPASYGNSTDKNKNSEIVMKDMNDDQVDHSVGPKGDLYAMVSKKGKKTNPKADNPAIAYGAVDNENFVAESDGAYDPIDVKPIKEDTPKASPASAKKAEGNYAELSSFRTPTDESDKPKPDAKKTEYASIEDLGPLKPHENTTDEDTTENADENGTGINVSPEKEDTGATATNDISGVDADTAGSRVNLI